MSLDPSIAVALITGLSTAIPAVWLRRRRSRSAVVIRRSLDRQEALEDYVFRLRRQVNSLGRKPHPWPRELVYLNRDDQDQPMDDEQP